MRKINPNKRQKAFRMRVEGHSIAEIARECRLDPQTVRRLEEGHIDRRGVRHRGWREELDKLQAEQQRAELECGMQLKEERIKTYERLAKQVIELIEKQFPNITMKNASDAKALLSEVRELGRLISIERGEYRPAGDEARGGRAELPHEELRRRYLEAKRVTVIEATPPREAAALPEVTGLEAADDEPEGAA